MCRLVCAFADGCKISTKILSESTTFFGDRAHERPCKRKQQKLTQMDLTFLHVHDKGAVSYQHLCIRSIECRIANLKVMVCKISIFQLHAVSVAEQAGLSVTRSETPEDRFSPYEAPMLYLSRDMRFPTMLFVQPAKPQISLRIRAV